MRKPTLKNRRDFSEKTDGQRFLDLQMPLESTRKSKLKGDTAIRAWEKHQPKRKKQSGLVRVDARKYGVKPSNKLWGTKEQCFSVTLNDEKPIPFQ